MGKLDKFNLVMGDVHVDKDGGPSFIENVKDVVEEVAGWAYVVAPSIALVLLIVAGIKYMNASEPHKREQVKERFKNIIIGLIVVFIAVQVINWLVHTFA
ncbi:pilin [Staphylococcus epidermidis]|uniref:pilin n=1 Tax=Staphylococcus epidermidis TaxID=1282 RepID=UPI0028763586|nr:pilin [Staphylococcus epidermidis]MDS0998454.1 pilin [Staphylococcus epidermidis]